MLEGSIKIPIAVGTVGGAISSNPAYQKNLSILENPNSRQLQEILAAVGLASNFAALLALITQGLRGVTGLYARNVALSAGVPEQLVSEVVVFMNARGRLNKSDALDYLHAHNLFQTLRTPQHEEKIKQLSSFFVEVTGFTETIKLNVIIEGDFPEPIHLSLMKEPYNNKSPLSDKVQKFLFNDYE